MLLVDAAQLREVVLAQRERGGGPQRRPVVTADREEPAGGLVHRRRPYAAPVVDAEPDHGGTDERARRKVRGAFADAVGAGRRRRRGRAAGGGTGRRGHGRRPGVRRRALPRRGGACASPAAGGRPCLLGVDIDAGAVQAAAPRSPPSAPSSVRSRPRRSADALTHDWGGAGFDVVVGNPPYLSQLAATHHPWPRQSPFGGGPYADAAGEFLALAVRLARPGGGRVGLVLPQSILGSRDVGPVRAAVDRDGRRSCWSWWSPPAATSTPTCVVCALGFERRAQALADDGAPDPTWTSVVTERLGVPALPPLAVDGTLGERATASANFRDEYYGLVPAVGDHDSGPPLRHQRADRPRPLELG